MGPTENKMTRRIKEIEETLKRFKEISETNIIEYVSILLQSKRSGKYWISKRTNPGKPYYNKWQCPGGKIEPTDLTRKEAAKRELFEETELVAKLEDLIYLRTNHYYTIENEKSKERQDVNDLNWDNQEWKIIEWRIVYCYSYITYEIPIQTETNNASIWVQRDTKQIGSRKTIDSLKDIFKEQQEETKIKLIEGACGCGKSTLVKRCVQVAREQYTWIETIDESFIVKDPKERIKKYGNDLEALKQGRINIDQMIETAINWEKYIRDYWMAQIFMQMTKEEQPEVLVMDRNLFSTCIFMKQMQKQKFYPETEYEKTAENYHQWNFLKREAQVYWIKPTLATTIKRLVKRARNGETDIEYFKGLYQTYQEELTTIYPNIKVIGQQIEKDPETQEYIRLCEEILK